MISAAELAVQIQLTQDFIGADPETLTVTPVAERRADGAGGWTTVEGDPIEIVCRMIPQSDKVPVSVVAEGSYEKVEYVLLAHPNVRGAFGTGATFTWKGRKWRVGAVQMGPEYEFKADIVLKEG